MNRVVVVFLLVVGAAHAAGESLRKNDGKLSSGGALTISALPSQTPWKDFLGANTGGGNSSEVWRETQRSIFPMGGPESVSADPARIDTVMATDDWINLQGGYNYRQQTIVDEFFNAVRADRGTAWRSNCSILAQAMVDANIRNAATGHKAYWELGNEIYADIAGQTIGTWVAANNLPYPHPASPYNDNPTHAQVINDRGLIGYQVEYQMALAIEALISVNATVPGEHRIRILAPAATGSSISGGWLEALLDYQIVGYQVERDANGNVFTNLNKPLASSLAGQRLRDLVDIVNVHYILGGNGTTLNNVFNTWVTPASRIQSVFHTEEGGINAANGGRGGLSALQNFARATDVWLTRGLTPTNARLCYYASGNGPVGTRGTDALTELHGFMPSDTTLLTRKPGLLSSSAAVVVESYTFENADATRRALFVLPASNTATTLTSVTMLAGGWNWTAVAGTVRLWSSTANAASSATVTRAGDGSSYTISFPSVSFTGANQQGLVILLSGSSPAALEILTPAALPFGAVNAAYSQTLVAAGGTAPYIWSVPAGALPAGVTLSSSGVLSGTPATTGTFTFTAQVTDGASAKATRAFSSRINTVTALGFATSATLRSGVVGAAHEDGISVTGGTAPYTQAVTAGSLPPGLSLSSRGLVTGTPTTAGTFAFTSTVTDAVGATASRNFSLTINGSGPSITIVTLPNGTVGVAYSQTLAASGGTSPYAWSISSGALPGGLTLSSAGVISGTPAASGSSGFSARVADATGATATQALTLSISDGGTSARIPLNDLGAAVYLGFQGGLYENGASVPPSDHTEAGLRMASSIQPLDGAGNPASGGKIVMISIGMSNTTQEFCVATSTGPCTAWSFVGQAMAHPAVNRSTLLMVNGARGGQTAETWDAATDPNYDALRDRHLAPAGATEKQVQVAWVKVANPQPLRSLPASDADAYRLVEQMGGIVRALRVRYPNIRIVFLSSRIYAGYATTSLNPEPYAYESAFAVKWLIQAQIDQMRNAAVTDERAGDLNYDTVSPWLSWGPYLWADGLNPRSDGLIWTRGDLEGDGTHPAQSGEQKAGALLLSFLLNDPTARPWFVSESGVRRRAVRAR